MRLVRPDRSLHRSWLAARQELIYAGEMHYAEPVSWPADGDFPGTDFGGDRLRDPVAFDEYVLFLHEQSGAEAPRPRAYVASTELWMVEGEEYLGRIALRHELNELLFNWAGHIAYVVRPSARGRGHATAALREVLESCRERGTDLVLVTCDEDNVASRRTIERAGGVYEDTRDTKMRFWIDLGGTDD